MIHPGSRGQFPNSRAPLVALRVGAAPGIVRRLDEMARPAECLKVVHVVGSTALAERDHVIAFEPAGPAA